MNMASINEETLHNPEIFLNHIEQAVSSLLDIAHDEKRITCGLLPAIRLLQTNPDDVLFCILPQIKKFDSAKHIQSVLLQAFCNEHHITIINVENTDKLQESITTSDCSCVLIHRSRNKICSERELDRVLHLYNSAFISPPVFKIPNK